MRIRAIAGANKLDPPPLFIACEATDGRTSNYNPAEMAGKCTHARWNAGRTSAPSSANGETACGVPNCTLRQVLEYSAQSTLAHGARRCRAQSRKCTERQVPATAIFVRRRNHAECQTRDLPHFPTTATFQTSCSDKVLKSGVYLLKQTVLCDFAIIKPKNNCLCNITDNRHKDKEALASFLLSENWGIRRGTQE